MKQVFQVLIFLTVLAIFRTPVEETVWNLYSAKPQLHSSTTEWRWLWNFSPRKGDSLRETRQRIVFEKWIPLLALLSTTSFFAFRSMPKNQQSFVNADGIKEQQPEPESPNPKISPPPPIPLKPVSDAESMKIFQSFLTAYNSGKLSYAINVESALNYIESDWVPTMDRIAFHLWNLAAIASPIIAVVLALWTKWWGWFVTSPLIIVIWKANKQSAVQVVLREIIRSEPLFTHARKNGSLVITPISKT